MNDIVAMLLRLQIGALTAENAASERFETDLSDQNKTMLEAATSVYNHIERTLVSVGVSRRQARLDPPVSIEFLASFMSYAEAEQVALFLKTKEAELAAWKLEHSQ